MKLTERDIFASTLSDSDLLHIVDVSDTTQSPDGSSFKLTIAQLKTGAEKNIYTDNGTLTGARTITQAGYALNFVGGNIGIGITPSDTDTRLHVKGIDATSSNYALKVDDSAGNDLLHVRNDGIIYFNNASYINKSLSTFQSLRSGCYFATVSDNINIAAGVNNPSTNRFRLSYYGNVQWLTAIDIQNVSGTVFGNLILMPDGGNIGLGTATPTATIHAKGIDATSSNYAFKADNTDVISKALFYVRNDGLVSMPSLQTGNAGLVTGDLYVDTAANILDNSDKIVAWKV